VNDGFGILGDSCMGDEGDSAVPVPFRKGEVVPYSGRRSGIEE
jgi:hypothetical protein